MNICKMSFVKASRLPEWKMNQKGTLYISQSLLNEIEYLHRNVGTLEWCGPLIYEKLEGSISKPETLKLRAHHIYPMDIGTGAHTAASFSGEDIVNVFETHAELLREQNPWKQGLIHTHHSMSTFFSGTDMDELHDNTPNHNYYLSLIVNFDGKWCAKVAFVATIKEKSKQTFSFKDTEDQEASFDSSSTTEKQVLMMIDMDIVKEGADLVSQEFQARFLKLKEEKAKRVYSSPSYPSARISAYAAIPSGSAGSDNSHGGGDAYKGKQSMDQGELWQQDTFPGSGISRTGTTQHKSAEEALEEWERTPGGIYLPRETKDPTFPSGKHYGTGSQGTEQEATQETKKSTKETRGANGRVNTLGEERATELALEWLKDGCLQEMKIPAKAFKSIVDGISYFDTYFENELGDPNYQYWLDTMAKALYYITEDYTPAIVSTRICRLFETWMGNSRTAHDLWSIADIHPLTHVEMEEERRSRKRKL